MRYPELNDSVNDFYRSDAKISSNYKKLLHLNNEAAPIFLTHLFLYQSDMSALGRKYSNSLILAVCFVLVLYCIFLTHEYLSCSSENVTLTELESDKRDGYFRWDIPTDLKYDLTVPENTEIHKLDRDSYFQWDIPTDLKYNLTVPEDTEIHKLEFILQSQKLAHVRPGENGSYTKMYPKFQYFVDETDVTLTTTNRSTDSQILLYAAVPKTGTTLLTGLLNRLGQLHNFTVVGRRLMPMFEDKYKVLYHLQI